MDPVTHTLAGVALGEAFFRERLGKRALLVTALAANLPDVDALVMLFPDPGAITLRRSFGHSALLLPLWAAGLAWAFKRARRELDGWALFQAALAGCALHVFLDLINSFGVQLLWPLTTERWELGTTFIIDLTLSALLAAALLPRFVKSWRPWRAQAGRLALLAAGLYLAACFVLRWEARRLLSRAAPEAQFSYVFPEPLGAHRWRGVARSGNRWDVYLLEPLRGRRELKKTVNSAAGEPAVEAAKNTALWRRLSAFLKAPVWDVEAKDGGAFVSVYDLRFRPVTLRRDGSFRFGFVVDGEGGARPRDPEIW